MGGEGVGREESERGQRMDRQREGGQCHMKPP